MNSSVLIIDDETTLARNIQIYLDNHRFQTRTASSGEQGLTEFVDFKPEVVLLDYQLGGMDGLQALRHMKAMDEEAKVILMTGHGGVQIAVDAMKAGAHDYLSKPLVLKELKQLVSRAVKRQPEAELQDIAKSVDCGDLPKLLGQSSAMLATKRTLQQFINAEKNLQTGTPPAVLITGATGTGKELVAHAFHCDGSRCGKPFVEINCASLPANLLEAELFGYERGAFTDAKERKLGLVETADGGTLFLDEIAELDLTLQAKLLRLLENQVVRRLGGLQETKVNVRIIAATNRDLPGLIQVGKFRDDLYFRLRVIHVELPPLCQRGDDVLLLAREFLRLEGKRYGKPALRYTAAAEMALLRHLWPGNVRELRNTIEQAVLLADAQSVTPQHLLLSDDLETTPNPATDRSSLSVPLGAELDLRRLELHAIQEALHRCDGNVTQAAKLVGLSRDTLRYRIEKYRLRHLMSSR